MRRLFLPWPPPTITGAWDEQSYEAMIDETPVPHHRDLVDLAATETWRRGGTVRTVPHRRWNRDEPCVGELRWKDGSV